MDTVLNALEQYRLDTSEDQKSTDLNLLEKECITQVNAYEYIFEMKNHITEQNNKSSYGLPHS